jgi:muramoyltetrapeptide carboxypeptidase LdcA involved in peptidoglycan recycling
METVHLQPMIKPKKLQPGDKVAAISLSWGGPGTFPDRYETGKQQFQQEFDLAVVETPHALRDEEWLHKHPQARADDLMQAFADPAIKAIISTIGGDDSIRLFPYLDLNVIRDNPKIYMGYSDATTTHLACFQAGLVSFYGPTMMAEFAENGGIFPYVAGSVRKTLFTSAPSGVIEPATSWTVERLDWADPANQSRKRTLTSSSGWKFIQGTGIHRGPLLGGCLDVLEFLRGTDLWPEPSAWQRAILFLETSEDAPPPSALKYALRSYASMGILKGLSGILFGRPGGNVSPQKFDEYDDVLRLVVTEEEGLSDLPIVTHMDFGHTDPKFILPVGVQAQIDCDTQQFSILENAVIE